MQFFPKKKIFTFSVKSGKHCYTCIFCFGIFDDPLGPSTPSKWHQMKFLMKAVIQQRG